MCTYKLVTIKFKWWGLQNKVENFIQKVSFPEQPSGRGGRAVHGHLPEQLVLWLGPFLLATP